MEITNEILKIAKSTYHAAMRESIKKHQVDFDNILKITLEAVFDHIVNVNKKVEQATDAQSNDGWITWQATDSLQPPVSATIRVQVKGSKGNRYEDEARNFCWGTQTKEFIIAYRIIPEAKEEKCLCEKVGEPHLSKCYK